MGVRLLDRITLTVRFESALMLILFFFGTLHERHSIIEKRIVCNDRETI
jgi:hypothetical protein